MTRGKPTVGDIWRKAYPFTYWKRRINKLELGNSHDALDALFIHSHLADTFATVLSARMRRPKNPWYAVKDELYTPDIYDTLETLKRTENGETRYFIEVLLEQPEGYVTLDLPEGWKENVDYETGFVNQFLGCPARFDEDAKHIETLYDPKGYMVVCNAVLNYWNEIGTLMNDFKHGFRILPFEWDHATWLFESDLINVETDIDALREGYTEMDADWKFDFWRMETGNDDEPGTPVTLEVHTVDVERCIAFSSLTLKLLYNIFDKNRTQKIGEDIELLFGSSEVRQGDSFTILHQQFEFESRFEESKPEEN